MNLLRHSAGDVRVSDLAAKIGWSRKHLAIRFREEFGLSPKRFARLLRFDRAVQLARASVSPDWAEIAARTGYADQAHFAREFRSFAGLTPGEFLNRQMLDGGTLGD
jgi:AraC-like DNA-binding protein